MVVFALAQQLRRCGIAGRLPHGLLDELVAPWGCRRITPRQMGFRVPCDCGRLVARLLLTGRGWTCSRCGPQSTHLELAAGRLLFALRLGLRGRYAGRLHARLVRRLVGTLPRKLAGRAFGVVQAATVVVSYDPRTGDRGPWQPLGPVGRALGGKVLDVWMEEWSNPVAYRARCMRELMHGQDDSGSTAPVPRYRERQSG